MPLIVSSVLSVAKGNLLVHMSPLLDSLASSCVVSPLSGCLARADPIPAEGGLRELAAVQGSAKRDEPGRVLQDVSSAPLSPYLLLVCVCACVRACVCSMCWNYLHVCKVKPGFVCYRKGLRQQ